MITIPTNLGDLNFYEFNEIQGYKLIKEYIANACRELNVNIPYLSLGKVLVIGKDRYIGYTITPEEVTGLDIILDKPAIYIAIPEVPVDCASEDIVLLMKCSISHEIRHVWQYTYNKDLYDKHGYGINSMLSPAEIDADGFAIAYVSREYDKDIVAQKFCKPEYEYYQIGITEPFNRRMERAKEFLKDMAYTRKAKGLLKNLLNKLFK